MILRKSRKIIIYLFLLANCIPQVKSSLFRKLDNNANLPKDKIIWSELTSNNYNFDSITFLIQNPEKVERFSQTKNFYLINPTKSESQATRFTKHDVKKYSKGIANTSQLDNKEFSRKNINSKKNKSEKTFISSNNEKELVIQSKIQSEKNNIFSAEGDVLVSFRGNFLKADNLTYDKSKDIIKSQGNVSLVVGNQIFKMSKFEYDLRNEKGKLYEVNGLLNSKSLIDDLFSKFNNSDIKKLNDLYKLKKDLVTNTPNIVNNWRFFADTIEINGNKWKSARAVFTNDLLELKQLKIVINALETYSTKQELRFKSSLNYLVLDEKISIPFWLGNRVLDKFGGNLENLWRIGYDNVDKDGLFVGRKLKTFNLSENLSLDLEPQFLIQRSFKGHTKSFVNPGDSVSVPEKARINTIFADYFAFDSEIKGQIKNWNLIIDNKVNTFDVEKLSNAIRVKANIKKEVSFLNSKWEKTFFSVYRDRIWNGSLGEAEIYNGYGSKLEKQNNWEKNGITKNEKLSFGIANIRAEAFKNKNLAKSLKGNFFYSLNQTFPINSAKSINKLIDNTYEYIPVPVNKGLSLNTKLELLFSLYKDGKSQNYLGLGVGPEFVFGDFKNKFFDYTRVGLMPFYKINSGESIFKFDQISENFTLDISFDQQLYGPIIVKSNAVINLDNDSKHYGEFINSKFSLNWKKRSFEFGIFYQPHNKSGGITFNLFGFE